jgi:hypothetical protein
MNKIATALIAAVVGATPILAGVGAAEARDSYKNGKRVYTNNYNNGTNWQGVGAGLAAGAALGLGAGLLINRPPPPPPVYYAPPRPPVVYYPAPAPAYYPPAPAAPVYYDGRWTEAHVQWCFSRYRSYNPSTNTFVGYDGYVHQCRGPYY